ncbi:S8 family serine peptidase [Halorubrum distributum]|uniref:S8 family serine peptidase n=1 Tax=Halorubrum distributum TaxID=29283 RepID=UPI00135F1690
MLLVDSIYQSPSELDVTVEGHENPIASDLDDTTGHGSNVLYTLAGLCRNAAFHFYRILADDREAFRVSNFLKAFQYAIEQDIDVVNASAGKWRPSCTTETECRLCTAASELEEQGVCLVAGAGNRRTRDDTRSVFCPARSEAAISVGTSIAKCTAQQRTRAWGAGPIHPPGAYWVRHPDGYFNHLDEIDPEIAFGRDAYCTHMGCAPNQSCEVNQKETPWEGNVTHSKTKPDILSPGLLFKQFWVGEGESTFVLDPGTSFSTPIVAGSVALVWSELKQSGYNPTPKDLKRAMLASAVDIDEGKVQRLNVDGMLSAFL